MKRYEGRVALVTGAGRGLGAAAALRLAHEGARVAVVDINAENCRSVVEEIEGEGSEALPLGCDVSDPEQVQHMVDATVERFGRLDILVNNAGILRDNLLFRMSEGDWDQVMAVHLRGAFLCSRAVQKHMVEQRYGRIISMSSTSALGNRGQTNYAAAKAGLQGFTRTLAIELGPFGITANAVAPGFIDTAMTRGMAERLGRPFDELESDMAPSIPLRRFGRPEEVASVVAFLGSDDASYVNGQTIYVAGGPAGVFM